MEKSFGDLTSGEFESLMDGMLSDEFDRVTPIEFFGALAAMDESEAEVIELTAHVEHGELVLDEPAPLPVSGNEIRVEGKRLVIRLRPPAQTS